MIICPKCGTANKDNARYCKSCGTLLIRKEIENKAEVENLKNLYANSVLRIKDLENNVRSLNHYLERIKKFRKEMKKVKQVSKKLDIIEDLKSDYERKINELKGDVSDQVKDAKYYKLRALTRFRGQLDDLSSRLRLLEKEEVDTDEKINSINQKLEKELKNMGKNLEGHILSLRKNLENKMNIVERYNRDIKNINEKIKELEENYREVEHLNSSVSKLKNKLSYISEKNEQAMEKVAEKFENHLDEILSQKSNIFAKNFGSKLENRINDLNKIVIEKLNLLREYDNQISDINRAVEDLKEKTSSIDRLSKKVKEVKSELNSLKTGDLEALEKRVRDKLNSFTESMEEKVDLHIQSTNSALEKFEGAEHEKLKRLKAESEGIRLDLENTLETLVDNMNEKLSNEVKSKFNDLRNDLDSIQRQVDGLKAIGQKTGEVPAVTPKHVEGLENKIEEFKKKVEMEIEKRMNLVENQVRKAAFMGERGRSYSEVRVRQLEESINFLDSRLRELESLIKKSVSNMPIIIE